MLSVKRIFIGICRLLFNFLYLIFCRFSRRNEVLFISRQSDEPSDDFLALGEEFEKREFRVVYEVKKLSINAVFAYSIHIVRVIYHLARCRVCFVDRYNPIIGLLNFSYDESAVNKWGIQNDFPIEPIIIQLWHAFGAFKCFGYQSIGVNEGHSRTTVELFKIHRNYSWIFCTGEDSRKPYSEAFGYPIERVLPLGRPEYERLSNMAKNCGSEHLRDEITVLFAPTLRKSRISQHPLREQQDSITKRLDERNIKSIWSFHPLEETGTVLEGSGDILSEVDYVVTDYSSIAYEAYLLEKGVLFYTPDIKSYLASPGLNINPLATSSDIVFLELDPLLRYLQELVDGKSYPWDALGCFVGNVFAEQPDGTTSRIVDFCLSEINRVRDGLVTRK